MKPLFALIIIVLFFGCSKSDNDTANPSTLTKTALLTSKDWVMTSKQIKKSLMLHGLMISVGNRPAKRMTALSLQQLALMNLMRAHPDVAQAIHL